MAQSFCLPECVDTGAVPQLCEDLIARRGAAVVVDASGTEHIGALGIQALLSARLQWEDDGHEFRITPASQAFGDCAAALGVGLASMGAAPTKARA